MQPATQRITDTIINGNEFKEQSLCVLLHYIEHLQRVKGTTLGEIHAALAIAYMNVPNAQNEALNTHLAGGE